MDLNALRESLSRQPDFRRLLGALREGDGAVGIMAAARAFFCAVLYGEINAPILLVCPQPEGARRLQEQINVWLKRQPALYLPEPESLPYQRSQADSGAGADRLMALTELCTAAADHNAPLIVTSAAALSCKVPDAAAFAAAIIYVKSGQKIAPCRLLEQCHRLGYRPQSLVTAPGSVSHRGGLVDIFPPTAARPARLEFDGDILESIRLFDPTTQRSDEALERLRIGPATEFLTETAAALPDPARLSGLNETARTTWEGDLTQLRDGQRPDFLSFYAPFVNHDSVLRYLPPHALLVLEDAENIHHALTDLHREAGEIRADRLERGELPPNYPRPYFDADELLAQTEDRRTLRLGDWDIAAGEKAFHLDFHPAPGYGGELPRFLANAGRMLKEGKRLVVVSHQAARLSELLDEADIIAPPLETLGEPPPPGALRLIHGSLETGWTLGDDLHLYSDAEIFGFVKQRRQGARRTPPPDRAAAWFTPGDYVVHLEHGIGRFAGITKLRRDGLEGEYLLLEYADSGRLFVPTGQIGRVERYIGAGEAAPRLSRLHTGEWARVKERTREAAEAIAADLLDLYAAREANPGHAFAPDSAWQMEMEAAFPYQETPDQTEVWSRIRADMESPRPMDRLVCGDAGYGKTEMAIRAAFKTVMDGRQVAFLVPTTVLAEQHFATLTERFAPFPLTVEVLSRFREHAVQEDIRRGLAGGGVDICIGTHRLLQADIGFKNLGLVIIDEEQRFGVGHKEYLKKLRRESDVLTLSATPIPRTMHMALTGVRDMSHIETPPEQRQPVQTMVAEDSDSLIREAILRELERNGQVFFVHNRVRSIQAAAARLRALVPEATVDTGHGQMPEAQLEGVMTRFATRQCDVLVCTTIIESGLDIPNANTLIVSDADRFGLTQLYQLRGRVGRGGNLAYAYFLYQPGKNLSETARRRLGTIFSATELGSGYNIALKDLEIRGAGNLLGLKQSGHISAVGFNLYVRLLAEAVADLKAGRAGADVAARLPEPVIDLPLNARIPESYVADLDTRLTLYHRLAGLSAAGAADDFADELKDRFGVPPREVRRLLYAVTVKQMAQRAGLETVSAAGGSIVLRRHGERRFDKARLSPLDGDGISIGLRLISLNYRQMGRKWRRRLLEILAALAPTA